MAKKHHEIILSHQYDTSQRHSEILELYPGIELSFLSASGEKTLHFCHEPSASILEINYCISGRIGWDMNNGNQIYLGPGDFSLNTMDVCANSTITMPNGSYEGIFLAVDLEQLSSDPPAPLKGASVIGELLREKYCQDGRCTALAANENVQNIFQAFFQSPKEIRLAYQKIKVLELLLVLGWLESGCEKHLSEYKSEQVEIIRQVHDYLTQNLEQRCSIESLSKQYLMNPTTLLRK